MGQGEISHTPNCPKPTTSLASPLSLFQGGLHCKNAYSEPKGGHEAAVAEGMELGFAEAVARCTLARLFMLQLEPGIRRKGV